MEGSGQEVDIQCDKDIFANISYARPNMTKYQV